MEIKRPQIGQGGPVEGAPTKEPEPILVVVHDQLGSIARPWSGRGIEHELPDTHVVQMVIAAERERFAHEIGTALAQGVVEVHCLMMSLSVEKIGILIRQPAIGEGSAQVLDTIDTCLEKLAGRRIWLIHNI